eukprot:6235367-Lingulodinium_polyedra.AAC.1
MVPPILYNGINCGVYNKLYSVESTIGNLVESTTGPRMESTIVATVGPREGSIVDSSMSLRWTVQRCPQWAQHGLHCGLYN